MEHTSISGIDVFLFVIALLFLILWIVWAVRVLVMRSRLSKRNAFIWKQYMISENLKARQKALQATLADTQEHLEDARAANDALMNKPTEKGTVESRQTDLKERLDDAMQVSHRYLRKKFGKDDIAELLGTDRKTVENLFKDSSIQEYITSWRIDYAVKLMQEDPSKALEAVADESGFESVKGLQSACRTAFCMDVEEIRKAMKI